MPLIIKPVNNNLDHKWLAYSLFIFRKNLKKEILKDLKEAHIANIVKAQAHPPHVR
jgi:hypothetical protein